MKAKDIIHDEKDLKDSKAEEDISEEELSDEDLASDENDSDADNEDEEIEDEDDGEDSNEKSGWADAMSKVLNSAKSSEPTQVVLSKARKDSDVKSKIGAPTEEGEEAKEESEKAPTKLKQSLVRSKKLAIERVGRQTPHVVRDKAREKALNKIATKGVVQLFNAVKKQQVDLKKDLTSVGKSIRKTEQVYKSLDKDSFLENVLGAKKTSAKGKAVIPSTPVVEDEPMEITETESSKTWSVLRDDFMLGAKMKDWDKNSDSEG
eukprot:TRINITY_DN7417_c0_g1_i2.p1 TRINITY_DN7417_c0_g1~~TRINITY_DN7417_c0_g1_i2.p1  ORF type:complete len:263 (-),score=100.45 TRINITY_DN7417_c0_g1_i2:412-1200(-)